MEHAECLARTAERKASAQRGHYLRRLHRIEMESNRLRVSVMQAENEVQRMNAASKKVEACVFVKGYGFGFVFGSCLGFETFFGG